MSDIEALANAKRIKHVKAEVEDQTYVFTLTVPVGLDAVDFRNETMDVFRLMREADSLRESLEPDRVYEPDAPEVTVVREKVDEVERAVLTYSIRWLRRTCTQCEDMDEEGIANILRLTGEKGPLVAALLETATATRDPAQEGLGDIPF